MLKKILTIFWIFLLIQFETASIFSQENKFTPPTFQEIYDNYSFFEIADLSEIVSYPPKQIEEEFKRLEKEEGKELEQNEREQKESLKKLKELQKEAKGTQKKIDKIRNQHKMDKILIEKGKPRKETIIDNAALANNKQYQNLLDKRNELKCEIKKLEIKTNEKVFKANEKKIKTNYEALKAQLDILSRWPQEIAKINEAVASGNMDDRKFGSPELIGSRDLGVGDQFEDLKILESQQAKNLIEMLKGMEYPNKKVKAYIENMIEDIAKFSDLKIPIKKENIYVSLSEEINAFAVGGGLFNVNTGLILTAENEAELRGVLSHEMAHVTARHSHRIMHKATVLGTIFEIAKISTIFIPGLQGIYIFLQIGFTGVGFLLNLKLLGASREFELEADTLGMQYMWNSGNDPQAFSNFFEKMGKKKGYIRKEENLAWLYTHPPFLERFLNSKTEYGYLPPKDSYAQNSNDFLMAKARICVDMEIEKEEGFIVKERPSLERRDQKEREKAEKECGIQKPKEVPSPCEDPVLEPFKQKVRQEIEEEKKNENKIQLKRG